MQTMQTMQTLDQAIRTPAVRAALASYHGVAAEPGAQIIQLRDALHGVIPLRSERSYTVAQLEAGGLTVVRGRYQSRTDLPPLPTPETAQDVADRMRCELHASMRGGRS